MTYQHIEERGRKRVINVRLGRLIEYGLCPAAKASKYAAELKGLVKEISDEKAIRKSSKLFKSLSDPGRLKILKLLGLREMCVCEIMVALEMTQPTASHHLNILENVGLVTKRRRGKWVFHGIADHDLLKVLWKIESMMV